MIFNYSVFASKHTLRCFVEEIYNLTDQDLDNTHTHTHTHTFTLTVCVCMNDVKNIPRRIRQKFKKNDCNQNMSLASNVGKTYGRREKCAGRGGKMAKLSVKYVPCFAQTYDVLEF